MATNALRSLMGTVLLVMIIGTNWGCAGQITERMTPVRVEVPVLTPITPPETLRDSPLTSPPPQFISPTDPNALVALDREGVRRLQVLLWDLKSRVVEWNAWVDEMTFGGGGGKAANTSENVPLIPHE